MLIPEFFEPSLEPLRRLGLSARLLRTLYAQPAGFLPPDAWLARITEVQRDHVRVNDGHEARRARTAPALQAELAAMHNALAVGDWVVAQTDADQTVFVQARLPPTSQLARRHHDGRHKAVRAVIVSNVDTVLVVIGLDADFNLRRLERYLAMARIAEVAAVVVLTKAALLTAGESVVSVDARQPSAGLALEPWLGPGQTLVTVGSSGAGKSTLTNTLCGPAQAAQDTGPTRDGDGRGRHTTTVRSLHLTTSGACLIDTPGLRSLRLDADAVDLDSAFDDIARLAPQCRFRDCRHGQEPGCAVREGVPPERLRNYRKLQREAQRDTMDALQRRAELSLWKQRSKASRQAGKARSGPGHG
jgi:ribosome biogenesis GTPase / thiamine phosphate phosphatase